jgi:hypothetical protein
MNVKPNDIDHWDINGYDDEITFSGVRPASYPMGIRGSFPWGKAAVA